VPKCTGLGSKEGQNFAHRRREVNRDTAAVFRREDVAPQVGVAPGRGGADVPDCYSIFTLFFSQTDLTVSRLALLRWDRASRAALASPRSQAQIPIIS
jgi:hypothetical protein